MAPATTDLPRPFRPHVTAQAMSALHRVLDRRNPLWYAVASALMRTPPLYRVFTFAERVVKSQLFGCRMCAQCALPVTAYACPMTCPKQLRNGPCGGVGVDVAVLVIAMVVLCVASQGGYFEEERTTLRRPMREGGAS